MTNDQQEYASADEESTSDELATLFTSLLVEIGRNKYTQSREGTLNSLSLASALTSRRCFQVKEESVTTPFVAMLVDTSGSQRHRHEELTQAARVVFGALQKAKVNVHLIQYDRGATEIARVPVQTWVCEGPSTNTGYAMSKANDWLEKKNAQRALMLIITDGEPDSEVQTEKQKQRSEGNNTYVLGVRVGFKDRPLFTHEILSLNAQFHGCVNVPNVRNLPQAIEPQLEAFIAGE